MRPASTSGRPGRSHFWLALAVLAGVLGLLFYRSFLPGWTLSCTDTPLGLRMADWFQMPAGLTGLWQDLNSIGTSGGTPSPNLWTVLSVCLSPLAFSKFYAPLTLLILGVGCWCCFRQWRLTPAACVLGALAMVLNSGFFSCSCWGVGSQNVGVSMAFLALAALSRAFDYSPGGPLPVEGDQPQRADLTNAAGGSRVRQAWRRWAWVALAGIALGLGVTEGADVAGLYSIMVAAFALFLPCRSPGPLGRKLTLGLAKVALMTLVAVVVASQAIVSLVHTNIAGVAGMQQDAASRQQHWDWATQWSLPKREALTLIVPGLFGYRMDAPNGAAYWGASGRDPEWDRYFAGDKTGPPPRGMLRYSGGGLYAGALVCCVALWTILRSGRRSDRVFSAQSRQFIWFWSGFALLSFLLAFGRFAPFYEWFYALPYVSTIRNPAKFMGIVEWALMILFAVGVDGLLRGYLKAEPGATAGVQIKKWWTSMDAFDRGWLKGLLAVLQLSLMGWLLYALMRPRLVEYLQTVDFDAAEATAIAAFSVRQPGWLVLFLALSLALLAALFAGWFNGRRAWLGPLCLGLLFTVDLGRANLPWLAYYDYRAKYAGNPVLERLEQQPYEHRVAIWPFPVSEQFVMLDKLYHVEWLQHHFPAANIQSLDIVQMRSKPVDLVAFETALHFDGTTNTLHRLARRWQLTNTRYLLGTTNLLSILNERITPAPGQFRVLCQFQIVPKPGLSLATQTDQLTAVLQTNGPYAVFAFERALPRVGLYTNWQVFTNSEELFTRLAEPSFAPEQTVLLSQPLPPTPAVASSAAPVAAKASFVSYAPKHLVLQASAAAPSVLLLNDRFDPDWTVLVDGRPERLLRCNGVMGGVYLMPGSHRVEFRFASSMQLFYISLGTVLAGGLLCGVLLARERSEQRSASAC